MAGTCKFVLISHPGHLRARLFEEALQTLSMDSAQLIPWIDLLDGTCSLDELIDESTWIKIDSPGNHFEVTKRLIAQGQKSTESSGLQFEEQDIGRIQGNSVWYAGFRDILIQLENQAGPSAKWFTAPSDIALMFDKPRCNRFLRSQGLRVPPSDRRHSKQRRIAGSHE